MRSRAFASVMLVSALLSACGDDGKDQRQEETTRPTSFEVELRSETYVDDSRTTPTNGDQSEQTSRTLETDLFIPEGEAPRPLVVFSHGFGASIDHYEALLRRWAQAGFVVAAPHFPLTYAGTPGGINGGDVENQPGDVSFLLDQLLEDETLGIDADAVAVAGHSNGGITTMGLIGNSCCREQRVRAALVLSGVDSPYSSGKYDLSSLPPTLWVHGTEDAAINYDEAVRMFNEATGPKGLLTLEGADHGGWLDADAPAFATTVKTTVDFFRAYLRDDAGSLGRLAAENTEGLRFAADKGSDVTIPTVPKPTLERRAEADDTDDLVASQTVTVSFEGFTPGGTINIVQCTGDGRGGSATCDLHDGILLRPNPTGEGSLPLKIVVGPVGNGVCDVAHPCTILVNDSGSQDEAAFVYIPIKFAA